MGTLVLYFLSSSASNERGNYALAQQYIPTMKYRDLVLDLGNGVNTNAQLTYPAEGEGPFPAVLLIHSSGALDKNGTSVLNVSDDGSKPYWQIAQYLSERGLQYSDMIREV